MRIIGLFCEFWNGYSVDGLNRRNSGKTYGTNVDWRRGAGLTTLRTPDLEGEPEAQRYEPRGAAPCGQSLGEARRARLCLKMFMAQKRFLLGPGKGIDRRLRATAFFYARVRSSPTTADFSRTQFPQEP